MGGKKTNTTPIFAKNPLSDRFIASHDSLTGLGREAAKKYAGPLTADLARRFDQAAGLIDPDIGGDNLRQAGVFAQRGAGAIRPEDIAAYANPFANRVNQAAQAQSDQSFNEGINQFDAGLGARAFGSRAGIHRGQALADKARDDAERAAGIERDSFNIGLNSAQADKARALQGSGLFAGLAGQEQSRQAQAFGQQTALASTEQSVAQSALDRDYAEHQRTITQPAGIFAQGAGLVPSSGFVGSSTVTKDPLGAVSSILGSLGSVAGAASAAYASGA